MASLQITHSQDTIPVPSNIGEEMYQHILQHMKEKTYINLDEFPVEYTRMLLMPWCLKLKMSIALPPPEYSRNGQSFIPVMLSGIMAFPPPNTSTISVLSGVNITDNRVVSIREYGYAKIDIRLYNHKLHVTVTLLPTENVSATMTIIPLLAMSEFNKTNITIISSSMPAYIPLLGNTYSAIYINGVVSKPEYFSATIDLPISNEYARALKLLYPQYTENIVESITEGIFTLFDFLDYYLFFGGTAPFAPAYFLPTVMLRVGDVSATATAYCDKGLVVGGVYTDKEMYVREITVSALLGPEALAYANVNGTRIPYLFEPPLFYVDVFTIRLPSLLYIPPGSTAVVNVKIVVYKK